MRWIVALAVLVASVARAGDRRVMEKVGVLDSPNEKIYLTQRVNPVIFIDETAGTAVVGWKCVPAPGATATAYASPSTSSKIFGTITAESCDADCAFTLPVDCYQVEFEATTCTSSCSATVWSYSKENRN